MTKFRTLLRAFALGLALGLPFFAGSDCLADKVTVKRDGRVIEGEITREEACCIWIKWSNSGVTQTDMFLKDELSNIERTSAAATGTDAAKPATGPADAAKPASKDDEKKPVVPGSGTPKALVLTMGDHKAGKDMVGMYMTSYALEQALPLIEKEIGNDLSGVVVLRVSSGGGALLEIQKISDVIHNQYKRKFRTVAWIESAISAAAMSAIAIEEIYFTPQGNFGACTGYSGRLNAVKGIDLEEVLFMKNPVWMRGVTTRFVALDLWRHGVDCGSTIGNSC